MSAHGKAFDALIIGAGPAGVSCAVWLARLGFSPALLEAGAQVGGLCRDNPFIDEWNASLPGVSGPQVADNLALSLRQAMVPLWLSCAVGRVAPADSGFAVTGAGLPGQLLARHIVLATGVRARPLADAGADPAGGPGAEAPAAAAPPAGILVGPGAHIVAQDFRGKRVAVLGGGDNAFENALYAMEHGAAKVHIYARTIRAQRQFVRKVPPAGVSAGGYRVDAAGRSVNGEPYDLLLVFYGWEPCMRFADALGLQRSAQGFIATDMQTAQTSCQGVYAIGEVAQRQHPCVVTALADGVTAAKAIQAKIEAGQ
ncbi:NAD(P)/FAD-dependent oxidoreductase [Pollutimonas bauzanensis]|uniref:Thioredoxin reductase n=1 Tax=Pollutimonas bauzanensis TaxID=658167 RepID=A0A1M5TFA8_9BURK|nr:NAD(P)/FAD-dependent oxidoreductase [Pollutimonas bauzanensis]SHH49399.1 Thioredoxin reductase [Pollutimonas bauzanensis]